MKSIKVMAAALTGALTLSLAACGGGATNNNASSNTPAPAATTNTQSTPAALHPREHHDYLPEHLPGSEHSFREDLEEDC